MERRAGRPILEPDLPAELTDLEQARLSSDLRIDGCCVRGGDVDDHVDELALTRSKLEGTQFTGATIRLMEASDVVFEQCELSGATFEQTRLTRVRFVRCRMSAFSAPGLQGTNVSMSDCRLDESWFRMCELERCRFEHCEMPESDFYASSLDQCQFRSCNLDGLQLSQARLETVAFHGSSVIGIKGAAALRSIVIGSDQLVAFAEPIFGELGITIDDEWDTDPGGGGDGRSRPRGGRKRP